MNNIVNQSPYLRSSREFPSDINELVVQLAKSYIDTSNAVNNRTISIFPANKQAITGESWYITNQKQNTLRQIYTFTGSTGASLSHNIANFSQIPYFSRMWGQYTDGTNWYGLIPASNTAITGQVSFYITSTNIEFVIDMAAPNITSGILVLEYMTMV